jgi:TP901-1 family phage major tail protein
MAAQKGKDLLLKIDNGSGLLVTVAGLRSNRIVMNAQSVDITHAESAGRWRELLAGAGVKRLSVTGAGVFKDDASDAIARTMMFNGEIRPCQLVIPDFGRIDGPFQITGLDWRGEHAGEVTFELSLESAGALTFTAI